VSLFWSVSRIWVLSDKTLEQHCSYTRFEVFTAVKMLMLFFWVITSCGLVGRYQRFGGTYCLHLQAVSVSVRLININCYLVMFIQLWPLSLHSIKMFQIWQCKNIFSLLITKITLTNFLFAWYQNLINWIHLESCSCRWAKIVRLLMFIFPVFQVSVCLTLQLPLLLWLFLW
jgi:hypothetical protein